MRQPRHILGSSRGVTRTELLVSVSIWPVVESRVGTGMFQVLSIQRFWTDDINAVREVRHAGSWFAGDALNATDVLDSSGVDRLDCSPDPSVEQVTLTWSDTSGATHNAVYSVAGDQLLRDFDGNGTPLVLATGVIANSTSFTLCGSTLRLNIDVVGDQETTDNLNLITYLRKLS